MFRNMKIGYKLSLGFGAVILLLSGAMGICLYAIDATGELFNGLMRKEIAIADYAAEIETLMLRCRRNEKDFLLRLNTEYLQKHQENSAALIKKARSLAELAKAQGYDENAEDAEKIITCAQDYSRDFKAVVGAWETKGLDHNSGLQGKFRDIVHQIMDNTNRHDLSTLYIALLKLRGDEKDYVHTRSDESARSLTESIESFRQLLNDETYDKNFRQVQQKKLAAYRDAFGKYPAPSAPADLQTSCNEMMRGIWQDMEENLLQLYVPGVKHLVLSIRRHEKDYLLRGDEAYVRAAHQAIGELTGAFKKSGVSPQYIEEIEGRARTYKDAFDRLVEEDFKIKNLTETMRDSVRKIEPLVEDIAAKTRELTVSKTVMTQKLAKFYTRSALIAGILGILLGVLMAFLITRGLTGPVNKLVRIANDIAEGDLTRQPDISQKDEIGALADAFRNMQEKINGVLKETNHLIRAVQEGRLNVRGNADNFAGGWRELVAGINQVIDAFVSPIYVTAACIERISKSDIPKEIAEDYQGDFQQIRNNLNMLIRDISSVLKETDHLSRAVQEGQLNVRGNADNFGGGWRELVIGINQVIDAFVKPIHLTAAYIEQISRGDIPEKITAEYQGDFNQIKYNLNMLIDATEEVTLLAQEMARGNLTIKLKERSERDRLMQALNSMIKTLNKIVMNVKSGADSVASGSQHLSATSEEMSQGTAEQASSAEEVSASMEEMASNIGQNADNAFETEKIALNCAKEAREGGEAVCQTVTAMKEIAGKISVVEEIARQTDLLALNAAIEAARAGEHGRGFAVVASEVRKLAERSRKAAAKIGELSGMSVQVAERAGEMLERIVPAIQKTAELVQEISAANNEQKGGTDQINKAVQQLDQVIQQNASVAEEMSSTSEELAGQAEFLRNTVAFFKSSDDSGETILDEGKKKAVAKILRVKKRKDGSPEMEGRSKARYEKTDYSSFSEREQTDYDIEFEKY